MFPFGTTGGRPGAFYQIDRSLRFNDDDSAYLSRTPGGAGNQKTWTWSGWVKPCKFGGQQPLYCAFSNVSNYGLLTFSASGFINATDNLKFRAANGGVDQFVLETNALYRDPSAWYHIVAVVDTSNATSTDRVRLYVNGTRITSFSTATYPTLNLDIAYYNTTTAQQIGTLATGTYGYYDGYLAEVHFVDGTALDPTSFGEFDENGVWRPIQVSGLTYGTNGFYLSFADNTSTTTLGYDDAGSNDWTLNNFSVTAGAGNDSLEDTPTNNFCTLTPLNAAVSTNLSNGNLRHTTGVANWNASSGSVAVSSGKWYWEVTIGATSANGTIIAISNQPRTFIGGGVEPTQYADGYGYYITNGQKRNNNVGSAYGATATNGDVIGVALDLDAGTLVFYKNNVSQGTAFSSLSGTFAPSIGIYDAGQYSDFNFGQRPFAYTPPTGFHALCTANLPTPDIADPGLYMNAVTYTGTGSSLAVTGVGFQPDLVWIKSRSAATDHALYDSTRGVQKQLESNTTTDETTEATGLTAFGADGFTVGALAQVNTSSATYVGWCWREGVTPGFDVVTYTGTGVARTISHNLGTVPKLIIVKARSTASTDQGWPVYHASNTTAPETDYLLLNSTAATADLNTVWNDTAPTTTEFSVGTSALVNTLNDTYVAYLFAEVEGFSKFGSYAGNASADGPFCWTGFRPRFIMLKRATTAGNNWRIWDATRTPINKTTAANNLYPNTTQIDDTIDGIVDFLSNGFKLRENLAAINASGDTFIFAAFAEQPFSAPSNAR